MIILVLLTVWKNRRTPTYFVIVNAFESLTISPSLKILLSRAETTVFTHCVRLATRSFLFFWLAASKVCFPNSWRILHKYLEYGVRSPLWMNSSIILLLIVFPSIEITRLMVLWWYCPHSTGHAFYNCIFFLKPS